ncbi:MAG: ABC-F family ATP-binding cassette domain-containing protein [Eubacteriales bacterium]|nr:ABC-F family ATP-binding cassette domain-containing protein [Eubacteriales bacterium]
MILSVSGLTKSYDGKDILKDISFHIEENDKCAITGINGAGKSTLLKQIIGVESPDSGYITIPKDTRMAYLSQNPDIVSGRTIYDEILSVKKDIIDMEEKLRQLEQDMQQFADCKEKLDEIYKSYSELSHRFEEENGYAIKSNVVGILKGLGFTENDFSKPVSVLSGGEKTRLSLGKLLLDEPDILLLDEPTNHLDIASISWLENYLKAYKGSVLIVSHDRYFLDRIVNKVLDIDAGKARLYTGNYTAFAEKKASLRKDMMKAYLNNQAEIKHQQEVIAKLKQFNREKSIKRAESREKLLSKIERVEKPFDIEDAMKLHFAPSCTSGNDVLYAEGLCKSFGSRELFSGVSLDVKRGEKLSIIGPNGTGKTTLLKIINGNETADSGEIQFGSKVQLAYYDQEHNVLNPDNTAFEEISDAYPDMSNTEIRNLLAAFLFTGDDVFKYIRDLSGGEKGRISLAKLMLSNANLLLLDEPTNHLDITSKEILEEAIKNYEGTVIYVSHDRYFINQTATRILELDHGHFVNYIGNYDYYLEKKEDPDFDKEKSISGYVNTASRSEIISTNENTASNSKLDYKEQKERKAKLQKLKNQLNTTEKSIEEIEAKDMELDELMQDPSIATNSAKLNEISSKKAELAVKLEKLFKLWEEQSLAIEEFENDSL